MDTALKLKRYYLEEIPLNVETRGERSGKPYKASTLCCILFTVFSGMFLGPKIRIFLEIRSISSTSEFEF